MKYQEVWKPLPGYESIYEVSDHGRVRSVARIDSQGRNLRGRVLKQHLNPQGYHMVCLSKTGVRENGRVHVLVARAFLEGWFEGAQALHKDDVKANNHVSNLRWGTAKQNGEDRVANGRSAQGSRNGRARLTEAQVEEIRQKLAFGAIRNHLRKEYGVSFQTIERIASGKNWSKSCAIC